MSAGAVFQEALRILRRQALPEECEGDLLRVLEAGRPGPLMLLYEAGHEAGLDRETLLALGLRKIRQTRDWPDTPQVRGMIHTVRHLVAVEEVAP